MTESTLLWITLSVGQLANQPAEYRLAAHYLLGQEIVYIGRIVDSSVRKDNVGYEQSLDLETTVLVLEVDPKQTAKLGCYTVVSRPDLRPENEKSSFEGVISVHFDEVTVTQSGRAIWSMNGARVASPADGWSAWELGYVVEAPAEPVEPGATWVSRETAPYPTHYRFIGRESIEGVSCAKVESLQQSPHWTAKDVTTPVWQRKAAVWLDPKTGLARRVHWEHAVREPGEESAGRTVTATYNQASNLRYHGSLLQERTADFASACKTQRELEQIGGGGDRQRRKQLTLVQQQLEQAISQPYATAYRPAMKEMLVSVERMIKDKSATSSAPNVLRVRTAAEIGRPARSFVVRRIDNGESITLKKVAGKPVLLTIADPSSELSWQAINNVVSAANKHSGRQIELLIVCTHTEAQAIASLKERLKGKYTLCTGSGLDGAYGVQGPPHTIFIDADGILRGNFKGYGPEVGPALIAELGKHTRSTNAIGGKESPKGTFLR